MEEVGSTGVFLASDASSRITGEVIYADCGYKVVGFWDLEVFSPIAELF